MVTGTKKEDVYASLLLTDTYLPGALVLAHSLRDAGTTKKLAILVTPDTVSTETVYDYVIYVDRIRNGKPANLFLMNRPDLHSAFTKINLWKQTQFRKIVYIDADVVAYRAVDELFDLPHAFSAAPDIGWPDLFNTGVMALTPNMGDYYAMMAMAERGISFDGADQGLLNMHFGNTYNRLSFTYNVTPSAHYQYVPAYRHFQGSINMVHFIGADKPWRQGRESTTDAGPFDEMTGRWWAVYDRHYHKEVGPDRSGRKKSLIPGQAGHAPSIVQHFVKGEYNPTTRYVVPTGEPNGQQSPTPSQEEHQGNQDHVAHSGDHHVHHESQDHIHQEEHTSAEPKVTNESGGAYTETLPQTGWDAQRSSPPTDSGPEAANFPRTHYEMSRDTSQFQAPDRYPSPPSNMWYSVPNERDQPKSVFPWENNAPRPTRVFAENPLAPVTPAPKSPGEQRRHVVGRRNLLFTPIGPAIRTAPSPGGAAWNSLNQSNAWDEIPQINRYVDSMQRHRRSRSQILAASPGRSTSGERQEEPSEERRGSIKVTDFPTEDDRPSLPVTPAPVRRRQFWANADDNGQQLPAAEGVPAQDEWDPAAQLQKLAKQQSEVLLEKLGASGTGQSQESISVDGKEIPHRPLPFGSEDILAEAPELVTGQTTPRTVESRSPSISTTATIAVPSYQGPGAMFEKGEDYLTQDTPAQPTEEDLDVLQT
ncbi:glycogenin glucosyltransferase [Podospora bellae-mahoneyi]|uniref:Glycogenin glucosyltransferase n=1 Tax=Podospora bellae-mahoneyi TaxID=2093777 RepID=A0ABR0FPN0_9PEZI|nr:glycogenin glucosyltransferase [Podospora bellae-mahoneyi]